MDTISARIKEEMTRVLEVIYEVTGLSSHWNGTLELVENAEFRAALHTLDAEDPLTFYTALLGAPLKATPGVVLGMGYRRAELPRTPFVRAFSAASAVLTRRPL